MDGSTYRAIEKEKGPKGQGGKGFRLQFQFSSKRVSQVSRVAPSEYVSMSTVRNPLLVLLCRDGLLYFLRDENENRGANERRDGNGIALSLSLTFCLRRLSLSSSSQLLSDWTVHRSYSGVDSFALPGRFHRTTFFHISLSRDLLALLYFRSSGFAGSSGRFAVEKRGRNSIARRGW